MKTNKLNNKERGRFPWLLITVLLFAWVMQTLNIHAQGNKEIAPEKNIALPGGIRGWVEIRDEVMISPAQIFSDYKDFFGLGTQDEMKLMRSATDDLGMTHDRYRQYHKGYRVIGSDMIVHGKDGRVQTVNGRVVTGLSRPAIASIAESQALAAALTTFGNARFLWQSPEMESRLKSDMQDDKATYYPVGELVWVCDTLNGRADADDYRLCWEFDISVTGASGTSKKVFVDAVSGTVATEYPISYSCDPGSGTTTWYGTQNITADASGADFVLHDDCTSSHDYTIYTHNFENGTTWSEYEDGDNAWTSSNDRDGVTTHWCVHRTLDYFSGVHGQNSWDDAGSNVYAYNNGFGSFASNACWGCDGNAMTFGEGSTTEAGDDWNSMDIVGHEFAHGVTQASAGLIYSNESGALNESFSDIFGTVIEEWTGAGTFDWLIAEEAEGAIRDMSDPNDFNDPDTYEGDNWVFGNAVHTNSGVQNFFFYLLCEGGSGTNDHNKSYSVNGIGMDDAADIAYRALTVYLTPASTYLDAREAWIRAASDLFGSCSDEVIATGNAWYAVGVGSDLTYYDLDVCGSIFPLFTNLKYNGINMVTGGNGCTTTINPSSYSVTFEAAKKVILEPGFTALEGSRFYAQIDPCNISYWTKTVSTASEHHGESESLTDLVNQETISLKASPSPFSTSFDLMLTATEGVMLHLEMFDMSGRLVKTIVPHQPVMAGPYQVSVDGTSLPSGLYVVRGAAGDTPLEVRVMKIK